MSAPLHLAAQRIQADTAGLTGTREPLSVATGAPAATTVTEAASHVLHGESGSLHYLFDNEFVRPVSTALDRTAALVGPHGGRVPFAHQPTMPADAVPGATAAAPAPSAAPGGVPLTERAAASARGLADRFRAAVASASR